MNLDEKLITKKSRGGQIVSHSLPMAFQVQSQKIKYLLHSIAQHSTVRVSLLRFCSKQKSAMYCMLLDMLRSQSREHSQHSEAQHDKAQHSTAQHTTCHRKVVY